LYFYIVPLISDFVDHPTIQLSLNFPTLKNQFLVRYHELDMSLKSIKK
jgi:hypothetical protein